jgi:hypothetical protein
MPKLIGTIRINPTNIIPGESVLIEVFDPKNISYASKKYQRQTSTQVCINDVHGAKQYLQFAKEGNYPIRVNVFRVAKGKPQQQSKTLTLKVKKPKSRHPKAAHSQRFLSPSSSNTLLGFSSSTQHPYAARFSIASTPDSPRSIMPTSKAKRGSQLTYHWKLAKGVSVETKEPFLEYDFESLLDTNQLYQNFHVEMSVKASGSKQFSQSAKRTLTVYNTYALSKQRGYIVPRTFNPYLASKVEGGFEAVVGIENLEDYPLRLTHQRLQALGVSFSSATELDTPIIIQAKTAHAVSLVIDSSVLPTTAGGFTLFLAGYRQEKSKKSGMPVRIEAHFDLPISQPRPKNIGIKSSQPIKPTTMSLGPAGVLLAETMPTQQLRDQVLTRLQKPGKKKALTRYQPALSEMLSKLIPSRQKAKGFASSQQPSAGTLCDPSHDGIAGGMVCQLQPDNAYEVEVPGHFINAQKGDILLSLGGDGVIAHLLRQVDPPQFYDHTGMITQDLSKEIKDGKFSYSPQQISHSTATIERWLEHLVPHFDGIHLKQISIKEDILKYSWPGLITQDTDKAIAGEKIADPDDPEKDYDIHSFDPSSRWIYDPKGQTWVLIPPMIVKPDPMLETPSIRQLLHQVAEQSRTQKSHYRLFAYTDASQDTTLGPTGSGWASNTWPSVCSSYIWSLLRQQGVHFEGDLEPDEIGKTDQGNPDGLYYYTAKERETAAKNLHQTAVTLAKQMAEQHADFKMLATLGLANIDEIAKQLANQIVNTFTNDQATAKAAKSLLPIGDGHAVSPADVMFWDGIETGGVYGYAVAAKFRPKHSQRIPVYRWTSFSRTGSLGGNVSYNNQPVPGAKVQLFKGKQTQSDSGGKFLLEGLPVGWHQLEVIKENTQTGQVLRAVQEVQIVTTENPLSVTLGSQGRQVIIDNLGTTLNGQSPHRASPHQETLRLSPINPHEEVIRIAQWNQPPLRLEAHIKADWQDNLAINVLLNYLVFSGISDVSTLVGQSSRLVKANQKETVQFEYRPQSGQVLRVSLSLENKEA